jgi:hypothetical protein
MKIEMEIGLNSVTAYRRLPYTAWHALAEFVDNSTQNYLNFREDLDQAYEKNGDGLDVSIVYDRGANSLTVADNANGMDLEELKKALRVGVPPENPNGRSKYGLGMKTAAFWFGPKWTIRTTRLGDVKEYVVSVDITKIQKGDAMLDVQERPALAEKHHTVIEITDLHQQFYIKASKRIRNRLGSMYRKDFTDLGLTLRWQGEILSWGGFEGHLLKDKEGNQYRREFSFPVDGREVKGWAGILYKGARTDAGFSIMQNKRVIRGWPEAWRPHAIYGDARNDLVNQRLVGEIHLDGFDVTHTKDDIQWERDQEDEVEKKLKEAIKDLVAQARTFKKGAAFPGTGPTPAEIDNAASQIEQELQSSEMIENLEFEEIPDEEMLRVSLGLIASQVQVREKPKISAQVGKLSVAVYLVHDLSPNDPYVILDSAAVEQVTVIVNLNHPYFMTQIGGNDGVLNYFRHCIYDAVSEARARSWSRDINPETIKMIKDKLLRVPFQMIEHDDEEVA